MRTRIITMLAALLLISISAFAQSSETPLKGDVNEDGKVDVADINAIIKIMKDAGGTSGETTYYWYVGGTQPTSVNESTWKKSTTDAPFTTTATATPGSDGYVWCAFPSNWNYDITDSAGFGVAFGFLPASIKNSISGYTIYRLVQDGSDTWTFKFTK